MEADQEITIRKDELMLPHECTMKGQYVTIKTSLIAVFAILTPITTVLTYYVSSNSASLNASIQLQLLPIVEKTKQNELRIVRNEHSANNNSKVLQEIATNTRDIKTDLKYNFVTKKEFELELDKKVDMNRIDKRNLKAQ